MKSLNLLIIDDDIEVSRMLSRALKRNWSSITVVHNSYDGLEAIRTNDFDIVLTDWDCPGENDGLKIVENSKIPVVVHTGNSRAKIPTDVPVIEKPSEISYINEILDKICSIEP